tara:strand:+ start:1935 stop:3158 length:1224 start_codon:yes stop_codon:yes gene_type:complete
MAYQSAENAQKLNDALAGRNDVATNNADPIRQMQGQGGMQRGQEEVMPESAHQRMDYNFEAADKPSQSGGYKILSQIGRALATSGELAAHDESQARLAEQDLKLRQDAMIDDTLFGKRALDTGNTAMFLDRLKKRIDSGIGLGHDMTESVGLYNLAQTDMEAAKTVLNNNYLNLVDRNLVEGIERKVPLTEFEKQSLEANKVKIAMEQQKINETIRQNNKLTTADKKVIADKKQQEKDYQAYKLVSTDLKNTYQSIGATLTGSLQGNLPAASQNSRMFETTQKQMLPLLKDVFRKPGEGTFTEGDQRLLTELLPNRTMDAEEFNAAITRLDAVVAMKVSQADLTIAQVLEKLDQEDRARRGEVAPPVRNKGNQDALRKAVYGSPEKPVYGSQKIDGLVAKHSSSGAK